MILINIQTTNKICGIHGICMTCMILASTCHGKCKDIFVVEEWGAKTILKNNIVVRQRGAD
jgi:hypothetical protein